jgi:hypothetical protein
MVKAMNETRWQTSGTGADSDNFSDGGRSIDLWSHHKQLAHKLPKGHCLRVEPHVLTWYWRARNVLSYMWGSPSVKQDPLEVWEGLKLVYTRLQLLFKHSRSRGSPVSIVSDYGLDDRADRTSGFDPRRGQRIFPLASVSRPALGPCQPPVQWVPGVLSPGVKRGWSVTLTTHPNLVPRSIMSRSYIYLLSPKAPLWSVELILNNITELNWNEMKWTELNWISEFTGTQRDWLFQRGICFFFLIMLYFFSYYYWYNLFSIDTV